MSDFNLLEHLFESIPSIFERVKDLFTSRKENQRQLFSEHVDPLYNDLCAIDRDYRALFQDALSLFTRYSRNSIGIGSELEKRRQQLRPLRIKLQALSTHLRKIKPRRKDVLAFGEAVLNYFSLTINDDVEEGRASGYAALLHIYEGISNTPDRQCMETLAFQVTQLSKELEVHFHYVTHTYASLRACLLR